MAAQEASLSLGFVLYTFVFVFVKSVWLHCMFISLEVKETVVTPV